MEQQSKNVSGESFQKNRMLSNPPRNAFSIQSTVQIPSVFNLGGELKTEFKCYFEM